MHSSNNTLSFCSQAIRSNSLKFLTKNEHTVKHAGDDSRDKRSAISGDDKTRDAGKVNKLTGSDSPVSSASSKPKSIRDRFFFQYVPRRQSEAEEADTGSGRSTVKEKYFYKVAVSEGLGQMNHIDSSSNQIHDPDDGRHNTADNGADILSVHFEPKGGDTSPSVFTTSGRTGGKFPTRMSTKPSNVMAWKLFESKE